MRIPAERWIDALVIAGIYLGAGVAAVLIAVMLSILTFEGRHMRECLADPAPLWCPDKPAKTPKEPIK